MAGGRYAKPKNGVKNHPAQIMPEINPLLMSIDLKFVAVAVGSISLFFACSIIGWLYSGCSPNMKPIKKNISETVKASVCLLIKFWGVRMTIDIVTP